MRSVNDVVASVSSIKANFNAGAVPGNFLVANVTRKSPTCYVDVTRCYDEVMKKLFPWNLAFKVY